MDGKFYAGIYASVHEQKMQSNKILVFYSHFIQVKVTKGNERQKRT